MSLRREHFAIAPLFVSMTLAQNGIFKISNFAKMVSFDVARQQTIQVKQKETTYTGVKLELKETLFQKSVLTVSTYTAIRHFVHVQLSLRNDKFGQKNQSTVLDYACSNVVTQPPVINK